MQDQLEQLWDSLLSRQPALIQQAFTGLLDKDRPFILKHLQRMATEEGWHPEQRDSAKTALDVINTLSSS